MHYESKVNQVSFRFYVDVKTTQSKVQKKRIFLSFKFKSEVSADEGFLRTQMGRKPHLVLHSSLKCMSEVHY